MWFICVSICKYHSLQLLPFFNIKKLLNKLAGRGCPLGRALFAVVPGGSGVPVVLVLVGVRLGGSALAGFVLGACCRVDLGWVAVGSFRVLVASGWLAVVPSGGCGFLS